MRSLIRISVVVLFCIGVAAGAVTWLLDLAPRASRQAGRPRLSDEPGGAPGRNLEITGSADGQKRAVVYDIILDKFEDGGYTTASKFMAPIRDLGSLQELREAVRGRGRRGISAVRAQVRPASGSTLRRRMSRSSRSFRSSSRSAFCTCTRASSSRPPHGSRRRSKPARHPTCPPRSGTG